jgi:glycosyltransferase involved in cell wall biosynthesis
MNDKKTLISIIVAVYNAEKYIESCAKSILAQTHKNIELILINDGSKDDSLSRCKKIAEQDGRVIVIDKENGGCYSAWNKGLEVANGDYIGFVDDDDYIVPEMYETLLALMDEYKADITTCNRFRNIDNKNNYENMDRITTKIHEYTGYEAAKHLMIDTQYLKPAMWDKLYKHKLFDNIRFPNTFFEDAAISYQLLYSADKVVSTEKQLYAYSVRGGSMITSPWNMIKTKSYLDVTNGAIDFFSARGESELVCSAIYWQLQFGIEAWERLEMSNKATQNEYEDIRQTVCMHYRQLKLKKLHMDTKKYLKKTVEFALFTKCPWVLFKIKKKHLR